MADRHNHQPIPAPRNDIRSMGVLERRDLRHPLLPRVAWGGSVQRTLDRTIVCAPPERGDGTGTAFDAWEPKGDTLLNGPAMPRANDRTECDTQGWVASGLN
jgi:hypothetical protein